MRSSSSALHAIRLVIGEWRARDELSVLRHLPRRPISSTLTPFTRQLRSVRASSSKAQDDDFLEDRAEDYETVSQSLPEWQMEQRPLPWPTLMAKKPRMSPGDPLHHAVLTGDNVLALQLLADLRRAGIEPTHRIAYMEPAIDCLKRDDIESFFTFMDLYPEDRRVADNPALIRDKNPNVFAKLRPLIRQIRKKHGDDPAFVTRFLQLCSRKWILAPIIEHLMADFAARMPSEKSLTVIFNVLETFSTTIPPGVQEEGRQAFIAEHILPGVSKWFNTYLRQLIIAGWLVDAQRLYQALPEEFAFLEWGEATTIMLQNARDRANTVREDEVPDVVRGGNSLATRMREALTHSSDLKYSVTTTELANILEELDGLSSTHPTLAARFRRHLIQRPGAFQQPIRDSSGKRKLDAAEIHRLRRSGQHTRAVEHFLRNYSYSGLPRSPLIDKLADEIQPVSATAEPPHPNIHLITSILPAIFETLPQPISDTIPQFHFDYLRQTKTLPPFQQPTAATHSVFVRKIARMSGLTKAHIALKEIAKAGFDPGPMAFSWMLLSHARHQRYDQLDELWRKMDGEEMVFGTVRLEKPSEETRRKLKEVIEKNMKNGNAPDGLGVSKHRSWSKGHV